MANPQLFASPGTQRSAVPADTPSQAGAPAYALAARQQLAQAAGHAAPAAVTPSLSWHVTAHAGRVVAQCCWTPNAGKPTPATWPAEQAWQEVLSTLIAT